MARRRRRRRASKMLLPGWSVSLSTSCLRQRAMSKAEADQYHHELWHEKNRRQASMKYRGALPSCVTLAKGEELPGSDWATCPKLSSLPAQPERPAAPPPPHEKPIHLFLMSDSRVGSTALFYLLAQSPSVATLCSAGVWQCESDAILEYKARVLRKDEKQALSAGSLPPHALNWSIAFDEWSPFFSPPAAAIRLLKSPSMSGSAAALISAARGRGLAVAFLILVRSPCTIDHAGIYPMDQQLCGGRARPASAL